MTATYWKEITVPVNAADVTRTYNGKSGCAGGCGGDYANANTRAGKTRINKVNKYLESTLMVVFDTPHKKGPDEVVECCVEIPNAFDESGEWVRCTRVYFTVTDPALMGGTAISHEEWLRLLR